MQTRAWGVVVALSVGCAANSSETRQPSATAASAETETQTVGQGVTPEQNDAIDALFRRKTPELQSCWQAEYDKTHNRKLEGDITVGLTVTTSGKPNDVKVLKSSLGNPDVEGCVVESVQTWNFPEVSAQTPYMRTVHIGPQF